MSQFVIRSARAGELPLLQSMFDDARKFMRQSGNLSQWTGGYPTDAQLLADINAGALFIALLGGEPAAVFALCGHEPTYDAIENGAWQDDAPYLTVHRLACVKRGAGVGAKCLDFAASFSKNVRADTHEDNLPMQRLLLKSGFSYCGVIHLADGAPRLAYQRTVGAPYALMLPDASMSAQIRAYRQEFLDANSSMDGCGSLRRHENPQDWLAFNALLQSKETVPQNMVQSTQYVYVRKSDRKIVGMLQIRHTLNDYLRNFGGHIGYSVCPSERRKGVATHMLHDALLPCRALALNRVLITCLVENEGSRRTILKNGGVYESTVFEPNEAVSLQKYWIEL